MLVVQEQYKCVRGGQIGCSVVWRCVMSRPPRRLAIGRVEQAWLAEGRRARLSSDAVSAASLDTWLEVSALIADQVEAQLAVTIEH